MIFARCPHCQTTFRAAPELLKLRAGMVRCGQCQKVFNALDNVVSDPTLTSPPPAQLPSFAASGFRLTAPPAPETALRRADLPPPATAPAPLPEIGSVLTSTFPPDGADGEATAALATAEAQPLEFWEGPASAVLAATHRIEHESADRLPAEPAYAELELEPETAAEAAFAPAPNKEEAPGLAPPEAVAEPEIADSAVEFTESAPDVAAAATVETVEEALPEAVAEAGVEALPKPIAEETSTAGAAADALAVPEGAADPRFIAHAEGAPEGVSAADVAAPEDLPPAPAAPQVLISAFDHVTPAEAALASDAAVPPLAAPTAPVHDASTAATNEAAAASDPVHEAQAAGLVAARDTREVPGYSKWAEGTLSAPSTHFHEAHKTGWLAVLMVVVLTLMLLVQSVIYWRVEIANIWPDARPWLEEACHSANCTVPYPRDASQINLEASELQIDPARGGMLVLNMTVKNRASFAQEFPAVELTLTDLRDNVVVRRILSPAEWLPDLDANASRADKTPVSTPVAFPANREIAARLWIDAKDTGAVGYRLYVFYP